MLLSNEEKWASRIFLLDSGTYLVSPLDFARSRGFVGDSAPPRLRAIQRPIFIHDLIENALDIPFPISCQHYLEHFQKTCIGRIGSAGGC